MRELFILGVLAGIGLSSAVAVVGTERLLRLATTRPVSLRALRSHLMKSAIVDATQNTEIVPAEIVPAASDYPGWIDEFDHQISALVQLARAGNRIAYNIICDLHAKYTSSSDQANQVAEILEHMGRGGSNA